MCITTFISSGTFILIRDCCKTFPPLWTTNHFNFASLHYKLKREIFNFTRQPKAVILMWNNISNQNIYSKYSFLFQTIQLVNWVAPLITLFIWWGTLHFSSMPWSTIKWQIFFMGWLGHNQAKDKRERKRSSRSWKPKPKLSPSRRGPIISVGPMGAEPDNVIVTTFGKSTKS